MKIAYFIDTLPPHYDGVVHTFCHLVETLQSESINFKIYSSFQPDSQFDWSNRVHKVFSLPFVLYLDYRMGIPYFSRLNLSLDDFNPDLIHAIGPTPLSHYGVNYAIKNKIKAVSSYHTDYISYLPYFGFPKIAIGPALYLQKRFYSRFDMIYAASKSAKAHLKRLGIKKIELWNRGVDLNRFSPSFRRNDLKKSINAENLSLLLVVGRLVKYKDLEDIVDIDSLLSKKNLSYKWVFAGQGPMRKSLQKKLPNAHFTGFIHGNELSQWYASSDLLVFTSTTETFGNVILEAFASGIPVIVSNRGGVTENIQEGINGIIAQAKSPKDFAEKIEFLLKNRDTLKKMGKFARNTAENRSWQAINLALLKSYEKVLSS